MRYFLPLLIILLCSQAGNAQIISTYAGTGVGGFGGDGGPAYGAMLHNPADIALDSFGNLYINDYSNGRIRKVTAAGIISTIAGCGVLVSGATTDGSMATADTLNSANGLAADATGNIYLWPETYDGRIIKVSTAGIVSTVAGYYPYTWGLAPSCLPSSHIATWSASGTSLLDVTIIIN